MKTNKVSDISLVVPCYNEIANIQKGVLDKIGNFTKLDKRFKEVIIVDDGSTDKTKRIIKEKYLHLYPKFRLVEAKHSGKASAVIRGILEAKHAWVMFTDIDLATPIEEAEKLMEHAPKFEIVIGSRKSHRRGAPITRRLMAVGMIILRRFVIGLKGIRDTQCGFKLFQTEKARRIIDNLKVFNMKSTIDGSSVSAGFDLEFLFVAQKLGYKIKEVPVVWRHVETKNVTFMKSSMEGLKDIARIKYYALQGKYSQ